MESTTVIRADSGAGTVRVLLFGHYRDYLPMSGAGSGGSGGGGLILPLPEPPTPAGIAALLAAKDGRFADLLARTRVAVRAEFAAPDTPLQDGDEIAFLPPMSGG